MAKRSRVLTKEKADRRWREGRGQGVGEHYQPWLTIQDVASIGLSHRIMGSKTGREHHLLSQNELRYYYLLEWSPKISDIREQFPLWHYDETEEISKKLGYKYPSPPGGIYVATTDFLITLADGEICARTVKSSRELENHQTLVKFDIEREYWRRRGVEWRVVISEELPIQLIENIEWLLPYANPESTQISAEDSSMLTRILTSDVTSTDEPLSQIASRYDTELDLPSGTCLNFCKHLIITRQWQVDMTHRINPARKLEIGRD